MAVEAKAKTKIKFMQGIAGNVLQERNVGGKIVVEARSYFNHAPGAIVDWDAKEAARFIESGIATAVEPAK